MARHLGLSVIRLWLMSAWIVLAGCAPYARAPRTYSVATTRIKVDLPERWIQFNPANPAMVITRDGLALENIKISVTRTGKKLKGIERRYDPSMQPHDIAELSLALLDALDETNDFKVEKVESALVAAHDGYHATATYVDDQGLAKRLQLYGAMIGDCVCEFSYVATEPVYYEKYWPVFEKVLASATVKR